MTKEGLGGSPLPFVIPAHAGIHGGGGAGGPQNVGGGLSMDPGVRPDDEGERQHVTRLPS